MYIVSSCEFISSDSAAILNNIDPSISRGTLFSYQAAYRVIFKMEGDSSAGVAAQVPFYDLCCLLEKISETSGTEKKKKILSTFVSSWREAHGKLHKDTSKTVRLIAAVMLQCHSRSNSILKLFYSLTLPHVYPPPAMVTIFCRGQLKQAVTAKSPSTFWKPV